MATEEEFRAALAEFGIGLELIQFKTHDRVNLYPTRSKGIHRIEINLRRHLSDIDLASMMKYSLSPTDFERWLTSKQVTLIPEQTKEAT